MPAATTPVSKRFPFLAMGKIEIPCFCDKKTSPETKSPTVDPYRLSGLLNVYNYSI